MAGRPPWQARPLPVGCHRCALPPCPPLAGVPLRAPTAGRQPPPPPSPRVCHLGRGSGGLGCRAPRVLLPGCCCRRGPPAPEGAPRAPVEGGGVRRWAPRCVAAPQDRNPAGARFACCRPVRGGFRGVPRRDRRLGEVAHEQATGTFYACVRSSPCGKCYPKITRSGCPLPAFSYTARVGFLHEGNTVGVYRICHWRRCLSEGFFAGTWLP